MLNPLADGAGHTLTVTRGSGAALGLPDNFRTAGKLGRSAARPVGVDGPAVVFSGSCSPMSRRQLDVFLSRHPGLAIDAGAVMAGAVTPTRALSFVLANVDRTPAVYSSADPGVVTAAQSEFGCEHVASAIETVFGDLAVLVAEAGFSRIVVGGGETSGAVAQALGIDQFLLGAEIDPGVPTLFGEAGGRRYGLALKSGNFGSPDFYDRAISLLAGPQ